MIPGTRLYKIYEKLPAPLQSLLVSTYGSVLRRRRYGAEHRRFLDGLKESYSWPLDQIREWQWQKLQGVVRHAYANVPYYRETWGKLDFHPEDLKTMADFEKLPVTEKQALRDDPWKFVVDRYREDRSAVFTGHTSGTTGKPLMMIKDKNTYQRTWAFQERQRWYWGLDRDRPRVSLHNRPVVPVEKKTPPFWQYNGADKQWMFSNVHLEEANLKHYLDKMVEIDPEEVLGFASALDVLAEYAIRTGYDKLRPKVIVTFAEQVYDFQRDHLSQAFGCPVADQYGSAEVVVWAGQCPSGTYHVNHEIGYFETLVDDQPVRGQVGEVVGTGFINEVQVLVRYRIGDLATLSTGAGDCACGWQTDHLESLSGRMDDVLYAPDGRPVGRLDPIARGLPGVRECQIVQDDRAHLTVNLVAQDEPLDEAIRVVTERLHSFFGSEMRIDCSWVEEIPRTAAGKFRYQLNTWKKKAPASGDSGAANSSRGEETLS